MLADKNQLPICGDYPGENHSLKGFELAFETTPAIFLQLLQPVKGANTRKYQKLSLKAAAPDLVKFTSIRRRLVLQGLQVPCNYGCIAWVLRALSSGCAAALFRGAGTDLGVSVL